MNQDAALNVAIISLIAPISSSTFADAIADNKAIETYGFHTGISPGLELLIDQSFQCTES